MAVQKVMNLLPEYQEKFLKDLLANIYQVDEKTGTITGIAAESPLYGKPAYQAEGGGTTLNFEEAAFDEEGNAIQFYETPEGEYTTDASLAATDQYGTPIFAVEGGVAAPDVIRFTEPQVEALRLAQEQVGAYQPFVDRSEQVYEQGVSALADTTGAYDPQSYKQFYDPFVEDVIDTSQQDIRDALQRERSRIGSQAAMYGAFGAKEQDLTGEAIGRAAAEEGRLGAQLRSAAYTGAQQQAQSAFENQMKRGQNAAQLFGTLGTGIGALGEATQRLGQQDVNALFNTGGLEQRQLQMESDVQRAAQLEEAYEPFARFSYMRDILSGVPSSGTSLSAAATPQASPLGNFLNYASGISSAQGGGSLFGGLGSLMNPSGVA